MTEEGNRTHILLLRSYIMEVSNIIYYPPEVSSMKYCTLGIYRKEYFRLVTNSASIINLLIILRLIVICLKTNTVFGKGVVHQLLFLNM